MANILKIIWLIKQTMEMLISNLKMNYYESVWRAWALGCLRMFFCLSVSSTVLTNTIFKALLMNIKDFQPFTNFVYSFTWSCVRSEGTGYLVHWGLFVVMSLWAGWRQLDSTWSKILLLLSSLQKELFLLYMLKSFAYIICI